MPLFEIKHFNALIDNKQFFEQPVKNKLEAYEKLVEMSKTMTIQKENYYITHINIINSLV